MKQDGRSSRRAVALLIVLATLILTTTVATIVVRAAATRQIEGHLDHCTMLADDLLIAAEAPIQTWLRTKSSTIVLSPEATSPEVAILHDAWTPANRCRNGSGRGDLVEVTITAWDQSGMAPLEAVESGSPLRLTVPDEILSRLPQQSLASRPTKAAAGLDQFIDCEQVRLATSPFPEPSASNALPFGDSVTLAPQSTSSIAAGTIVPSFGAHIATHSAAPGAALPGAGAGAGAINVNTAPLSLVEAALRLAGRGGLEQIIAARQAGKPATVSGQIHPSFQLDQFAPQLVTTSYCWSFRIDITVSPLKRSWWAVYQNSSGKWELVQRLVITH
jgi:hypothetical protein